MTRAELDAAGDWAFPARHTPEHSPGMTLRDWFAGQALASIPNRSWDDVGDGHVLIKAWAKCAYAVADAMLAQRLPQANAEASDG